MRKAGRFPPALAACLALGHVVGPARSSGACDAMGVRCGALQWLLGDGLPVDAFFAQYWERQPLHVRRRNTQYYDGALGFSQDRFLRCVDAGHIEHGKHVFWSSYRAGKRRRRRMVGRASRATAQRLFAQGLTAQVHTLQRQSVRTRAYERLS